MTDYDTCMHGKKKCSFSVGKLYKEAFIHVGVKTVCRLQQECVHCPSWGDSGARVLDSTGDHEWTLRLENACIVMTLATVFCILFVSHLSLYLHCDDFSYSFFVYLWVICDVCHYNIPADYALQLGYCFISTTCFIFMPCWSIQYNGIVCTINNSFACIPIVCHLNLIQKK